MMISDIEIINIITTRNRGGKIVYHNDFDNTEYLVDNKHMWDFITNKYRIVDRFTSAKNNKIEE